MPHPDAHTPDTPGLADILGELVDLVAGFVLVLLPLMATALPGVILLLLLPAVVVAVPLLVLALLIVVPYLLVRRS